MYTITSLTFIRCKRELDEDEEKQVIDLNHFKQSVEIQVTCREAEDPRGGGGGGGGEVLEVYMTGGSDGASYCKPKKQYTSLKF